MNVNPEVVGKRVGDDYVLVNLETNRIYTLNRTGARFWELLSQGHPADEIRGRLLGEFNVDEGTLTREIDQTLATLRSEGLVRE
jgi:hypothetical protein